jgi:hypothetical protein
MYGNILKLWKLMTTNILNYQKTNNMAKTKIQMTSGKEFEIDFETENGYQQMREMYIHLQSKGFFKEILSEDEKIKDMIDTLLVPNFPTIDRDVIEMVSKHYLTQLNERKQWGEIDDIDVAIQLGKLIILELEDRWS